MTLVLGHGVDMQCHYAIVCYHAIVLTCSDTIVHDVGMQCHYAVVCYHAI